MSLGSALQIASGGLANINRQIAVVSQNIGNVNTPGYAREIGTQTSATADGQGLGVITGPVQREIDLQLQRQVFTQNATVAGLNTQAASLSAIDVVQGTPGQGTDLPSLLGQLQNAFVALQPDPSSTAGQQQVVNAATSLARQLNALSDAYGTARQNAQDAIVTDVGTLNQDLSTLSNLTARIMSAQQSGQSTAGLENIRDTTMGQVSGMIDVRFITQPNGAMTMATKGGLTLPLQNPAPQLMVQQTSAAPSTFYPGGGIGGIMLNGVDVTGALTGGQIGANLALRDKTVPTYQGALDEFAKTLSTRFSSQGLQLFTMPAGGSSAILPPPAQTGYVGYAGSIAVNPAVQATASLVRDGTAAVAGSATGASAFSPNPAGGPAGFTGLIQRVITFSLGAQVQSGVTQPAPATLGLGPAGTLSAPFQAPADLASFASDIVSSQSTDVSATQSQVSTETSIQAALQSRLQTTSTVNVDSEMSRMLELQNAYGANARIISAVQAMWTQLLQAIP